MSLLITGSHGLLGSHIADAFKRSGIEVLTPTRQELNSANFKEVVEFIAENAVNEIIHCAAKVGGISENIRKPADFILDNLLIDSNLLSAARIMQVPKLLYFGSSCMYPPEGIQPFQENQILSGYLETTNEGYALAKTAGVKSVVSVAVQDQLVWKSLILSNIYGPRDNFSPEDGHLVASIIRKVVDAKKSGSNQITIWGTGDARREFTYVDDVAEYIATTWGRLETLPNVMNLGAGQDYSVYDYYQNVCEILGVNPSFSFDLDKPNGMESKLMDSSLAIQFGWSAKTRLRPGLEKTVQWFEKTSRE